MKNIYIFHDVSKETILKGGPLICMNLLQKNLIKYLESDINYNFIKIVNNLDNIQNSIIFWQVV